MSYLLAKDTVNGAEGKVFITVDGKNIEVACMRNITTNADIQSNDMRVIGTRKIQDKPSGVKQTGKGNVYYGTDLFTNMVLQYINTGRMPEFDIPDHQQRPRDHRWKPGHGLLWLPPDRQRSSVCPGQRGVHVEL